jgi:TldD protein
MAKSINHLATADNLFFGKGALDRRKTEKMVDDALAGCDDGELFLEYEQSESLSFDDGKLKSASFDTTQGFGLRSVAGEATGFAHASALDEQALKRAVATVKAVRAGHSGEAGESPRGTNQLLYADDNPIDGEAFARKVALLQEIDAYVRGKEPKARQVSISLSGSWQVVEIIKAGGWRAADVRPLVRLNVSVVCADGSRMEAGSTGSGRRAAYGDIFKPEYWRREADEAIRQSLVNLQSVPAPAGEMPVVLGSGWSGVLWHEAVGHGLEGDFHRKKTSMFTSMMGDMIASPGVTVVDDGTLADRRGSLTIDDEGTPTQRNVLIENGRLVGLMQDRQNARLMGVKPTGNGRRQSHAYAPMPRMTNTFMLAGDKDLRQLRRRPGRHRLRQVRVHRHRGLPDRGRQARRAGQGRDADRCGLRGADQGRHGRQRHVIGPGHWHLRQGRPGRACGRRPADAAHRRADRRRYGDGLSLRRRLGVVGLAHRLEPARRLALVVGL